ncbi:MAG: UrcA family protein [Rhodospirillaceae bacterium]|nr:UrcA family protein [Rhodospirillaceae bacterium]
MFAVAAPTRSARTLSVAALIGATLALAALPAPSQAGDAMPVTTRSITVDYADLDLTSDAGRDTLQHRLKQAAERACAPSAAPAQIALHRIYSACVKTAQANATKQYDAVIAAVEATTNVAAAN